MDQRILRVAPARGSAGRSRGHRRGDAGPVVIGPTPAPWSSARRRRVDRLGNAGPWSSARRRPDGWAVPSPGRNPTPARWLRGPVSQPSGPTPARGSAGQRRPRGHRPDAGPMAGRSPLQVETRRRPDGCAVPWSQPSGPTPARGSAGRRRPRGSARRRRDGCAVPWSQPSGPTPAPWIGWATPARRRPVVPPIAPARRPNILTQWGTQQSRLRV